MTKLKKLLRLLLPEVLVRWLKITKLRLSGVTTQQIFTEIYQKGTWGASADPDRPFYSGSGSDDDTVVSCYVSGVQRFLSTFPEKPNVVDLGCGDYSVGSRLRPYCNRYTACDIVPPLIEFNRKKFESMDVDFRVLDLTSDPLPSADIVFIRQVLQHLSNRQIRKAIPEIEKNFKYLVLTEHLPKSADFVPNLDTPPGAGIRLDHHSGIVLTKPPFNLRPISEEVLCEAEEIGGLIRTIVYRLRN